MTVDGAADPLILWALTDVTAIRSIVRAREKGKCCAASRPGRAVGAVRARRVTAIGRGYIGDPALLRPRDIAAFSSSTANGGDRDPDVWRRCERLGLAAAFEVSIPTVLFLFRHEERVADLTGWHGFP